MATNHSTLNTHCVTVQLLQVPLRSPRDTSSRPWWTHLITSLQGVDGITKVVWASQHEDEKIQGIVICWDSRSAQKTWADSVEHTTWMSDIKSLATGPLCEDIVFLDESVNKVLGAQVVEIVSWIHPTSQIDGEKIRLLEDGFLKFQKAISNETSGVDGGLVAGLGQIEFVHQGVRCHRFTSLIGWKSVQTHYDCKATPAFMENIQWLTDQNERDMEMVHYSFGGSS
ncbi:uncharacterized protein N7483_001886 [Penicillium malachiteum]|uniref:uncharacterized protein n=1 Tax=Penicillium malachiteum TaxID=1324776 RepID=UPI002546AE47|nr:uncharacterized protein N7483_001886 [Penicillium malachiteum]KAJ5736761.1 hypothetical protein N7483_001886 [Penicillium malachiteum]